MLCKSAKGIDTEVGTCALPLQSACLQRLSATGSNWRFVPCTGWSATVALVFLFLDFGGPGLIRKALECMDSQARSGGVAEGSVENAKDSVQVVDRAGPCQQ